MTSWGFSSDFWNCHSDSAFLTVATKAFASGGRIDTYPMNWDSEKEMSKDVEENEELYEALADTPDDVDDDE